MNRMETNDLINLAFHYPQAIGYAPQCGPRTFRTIITSAIESGMDEMQAIAQEVASNFHITADKMPRVIEDLESSELRFRFLIEYGNHSLTTPDQWLKSGNAYNRDTFTRPADNAARLYRQASHYPQAATSEGAKQVRKLGKRIDAAWKQFDRICRKWDHAAA